MVEYTKVDLDNNKIYNIIPLEEYDVVRFQRTMHNLNNMLKNGNPISLIVPERKLNSDELEEYRIYFCKEAKRVRRNLIYLEIPSHIREIV